MCAGFFFSTNAEMILISASLCIYVPQKYTKLHVPRDSFSSYLVSTNTNV